MPREPIIVAGAGIVGASIAYHLATRGARVIIRESASPAAAASGKSFGWINATFSKRPRHYFDLNVQAIADWHRLEQELDHPPPIQWGGSLTLHPDEEEIRNHQEWGYPMRRTGNACACESEGAVDPIAATQSLLNAAQALGAELYCNSPLETIPADNTVVLACGTAIPSLASQAGIRVRFKESPGVLVHSTPLPPILDHVVIAPDVHFKQAADGRIVAGGQLVAGAGTATTATTEAHIDEAEEIFARARRHLPALENAGIDYVTLGHRVMPEDEYPIVGFAKQDIYIAAMHSGVTLAPLFGRLAAAEILDDAPTGMLAPYRPSRFA